MIVGHLPAGYLVSRLVFYRLGSGNVKLKWLLLIGLFGSIAPDLDLFYAYFFAHTYRHHHTYWTHLPIVWFSLLLLSIGLRSFGLRTRFSAYLLAFSLNGFVHMILDTIAGDIWWLAPFVDESYTFYSQDMGYERRWMNILFNWAFAVEMGIVASALYLGYRDIRVRRKLMEVGGA
ncbi:MAG: metal-dependent hydrolase [Candidatus Thiodiazotropha sp.]|jgi:hypothetical protein